MATAGSSRHPRDVVGLDQVGERRASALAHRRAQRLDGRRRPHAAGQHSIPERHRVALHAMADRDRLYRQINHAGVAQQRPQLRVVGEAERIGPGVRLRQRRPAGSGDGISDQPMKRVRSGTSHTDSPSRPPLASTRASSTARPPAGADG